MAVTLGSDVWLGYYGNVYFQPIKVVRLSSSIARENEALALPLKVHNHNLRVESRSRHSSLSRRSRTGKFELGKDNSRRLTSLPQSAAFNMAPVSSPTSSMRSSCRDLDLLVRTSNAHREQTQTHTHTQTERRSAFYENGKQRDFVEIIHNSSKNFPIRKGHVLLSQADRVRVPAKHAFLIDNANMNSFELNGQKLDKRYL